MVFRSMKKGLAAILLSGAVTLGAGGFNNNSFAAEAKKPEPTVHKKVEKEKSNNDGTVQFIPKPVKPEEIVRPVRPEEINRSVRYEGVSRRTQHHSEERREKPRVVVRYKDDNWKKIGQIISRVTEIGPFKNSGVADILGNDALDMRLMDFFDLEKKCYFGDKYNEDGGKINHSKEFRNGSVEYSHLFRVIRYNLHSGDKITLGVKTDKKDKDVKFKSEVIDFESERVLNIQPKVVRTEGEIKNIYDSLGRGSYIFGWFANDVPIEFYKVVKGQREILKDKPVKKRGFLDFSGLREVTALIAMQMPAIPITMCRNEILRKFVTASIMLIDPEKRSLEDIKVGDVYGASAVRKLGFLRDEKSLTKKQKKLEKMCYFGRKYNKDKKLKDHIYSISPREPVILGVKTDKKYDTSNFETRVVNLENERVLDVKPREVVEGKYLKHIYPPLKNGMYMFGWKFDGGLVEHYNVVVGRSKYYEKFKAYEKNQEKERH